MTWYTYSLLAVLFFFALLLGFCYLEEGLWDSLVWHENPDVFYGFSWLAEWVKTPPLWLIVPVLAIPQVTHYILDGFIWRKGLPGNNWAKILFSRPPTGG